MAKFILSCAVTGAIHTPTMAPHLPIKPEDIARQAIEAANAGAAIVHIHARDPHNGLPTPHLSIMGEIISRIHTSSDAVICVTTGGGANMSVEERISAIPQFKPELASVNLGSMNFALFPALGKYKEWKYEWEPAYLEATRDFVFRNTFADLEKILRIFRENGTKPEFEAYDVGHLHNAHHFFLEAAIQSPVLVQFVMGILGGITATIPHLLHLKKTAEELFRDDLIFSTIAAGRNEFATCTTSFLLGGGARVGLEDNLWLDKGVMARNNAELVEKMVRIAREFDLEPAEPNEVRAILGLKGKDLVNI